MYKLYYAAGSCSMAVHVVLNECGAAFDLSRVPLRREGKEKPQEFLQINPRGSVPVLIDGDQIIREGAAILIYLLEKEKSALLPPAAAGKDRARALEWLCWCNATLHPAYSRIAWLRRTGEELAQKNLLIAAAVDDFAAHWEDADRHLAASKFLAGDQCTAADILMTVIANWKGWLPRPISYGANVRRVLQEVSARPAYQKALQTEGVQYQALAA